MPNGILERATSFIPAGILFFMKDSFYFPHFYNARNDRKILRLRRELGTEGYGIYFMILEVLRDSSDFKYPMEDIDLLADDFGVSEAKVRTVICNYQLFEVDQNEKFFSAKFNEYMAPYLKMKEQRRIAGIASATKRLSSSTDVQQPFNDRSTTVQQIKERKVNKENKANKESKEIKVPPIQDVINFFEENGYMNAEKAWHYYNDADWKDRDGKPVLNWKQKMRVVWFKDENKKKIDEQQKIAAYNRDLWNRERAAIGLPPL